MDVTGVQPTDAAATTTSVYDLVRQVDRAETEWLKEARHRLAERGDRRPGRRATDKS